MQQLYDCTVRLGGSMKNEVRMTDVTAAEIQVLKVVHNGAETGVDVVHKIERKGQAKRDDYDERARLSDMYGRALAKLDPARSIDQLFGHETVPLPQTVRGVDALPPPKTGRRAQAPKAEAAPEAEPAAEQISETEFA